MTSTAYSAISVQLVVCDGHSNSLANADAVHLTIDNSVACHSDVSVIRGRAALITLIKWRPEHAAFSRLVAHVDGVHSIDTQAEDVISNCQVVGRSAAWNEVAHLNGITVLEARRGFELTNVVALDQEVADVGKVDRVVLDVSEHTADQLSIVDASTEGNTSGDPIEGTTSDETVSTIASHTNAKSVAFIG